eukprot:TRINITY_DN7371_c0_g2_i1.p1 TRINITY_DN7371_c0_g2~~TRINITY_DN7371_c0_g2_i1.p1  ORF type:complete len:546 (-),score=103.14 TRINITY_DN7371_c0_g2_i1:29-1666(-)
MLRFLVALAVVGHRAVLRIVAVRSTVELRDFEHLRSSLGNVSKSQLIAVSRGNHSFSTLPFSTDGATKDSARHRLGDATLSADGTKYVKTASARSTTDEVTHGNSITNFGRGSSRIPPTSRGIVSITSFGAGVNAGGGHGIGVSDGGTQRGALAEDDSAEAPDVSFDPVGVGGDGVVGGGDAVDAAAPARDGSSRGAGGDGFGSSDVGGQADPSRIAAYPSVIGSSHQADRIAHLDTSNGTRAMAVADPTVVSVSTGNPSATTDLQGSVAAVTSGVGISSGLNVDGSSVGTSSFDSTASDEIARADPTDAGLVDAAASVSNVGVGNFVAGSVAKPIAIGAVITSPVASATYVESASHPVAAIVTGSRSAAVDTLVGTDGKRGVVAGGGGGGASVSSPGGGGSRSDNKIIVITSGHGSDESAVPTSGTLVDGTIVASDTAVLTGVPGGGNSNISDASSAAGKPPPQEATLFDRLAICLIVCVSFMCCLVLCADWAPRIFCLLMCIIVCVVAQTYANSLHNAAVYQAEAPHRVSALGPETVGMPAMR